MIGSREEKEEKNLKIAFRLLRGKPRSAGSQRVARDVARRVDRGLAQG